VQVVASLMTVILFIEYLDAKGPHANGHSQIFHKWVANVGEASFWLSV
jgi:hypothetical protein